MNEDHADNSAKAVVDGLRAKYRELEKQRAEVQSLLQGMAEKLRNINNELVHLSETGRMFGADLPMPAPSSSATASTPFLTIFRKLTAAGENARLAMPKLEPKPVDAPVPKIKDLVLDRLKAAGEKGAKASEIRQFIESTYGKEIHEKTVGMNLYRFLRAGKARRDGIIWFFVPPEAEKKNPGGDTPGSIEDLLK